MRNQGNKNPLRNKKYDFFGLEKKMADAAKVFNLNENLGA